MGKLVMRHVLVGVVVAGLLACRKDGSRSVPYQPPKPEVRKRRNGT